MTAPIVLASASPRRQELLQLLGVEFRVVPSHAEEPPYEASVTPSDYAIRLARLKAAEVADRVGEGIVIGADTIVTLDGQVFGKPLDADDAARMLKALGGRTHSVITGVHVLDCRSRQAAETAVETRVTFRELSDRQIVSYVTSGEPMDKAGAYAIQGRGAVIVTRIEGCYFNVVGLPVPTVASMLAECGVPLLGAD